MFMEAIEKAGINGLITAAATVGYFGSSATVQGLVRGTKLPLYLLTGVAGAAGSVAGDAVHLGLNEAIPISSKANDRMSVITGAAINGAALGMLLYVYQPQILNDFGLITAVGFGAGAEVAGSALYTYLKENQYF